MWTIEPTKRPIVIVGTKVYRGPTISIHTEPKIPLDDFVFGRYDSTVKTTNTVNGDLVEGVNVRPTYRKSGRLLVCMDK